MTLEYTLEQFTADFDDIESVEGKQEVLDKLIESGVADDDFITEYKEKINDLIVVQDVEQDMMIDIKIESGEFQLYTCTKSIDKFVEGSNYYVAIDDVKSKYLEQDLPDAILQYVSNIKPLVWIVTDNGIGTLKRKNLFNSDDFSKYFTKFAL